MLYESSDTEFVVTKSYTYNIWMVEQIHINTPINGNNSISLIIRYGRKSIDGEIQWDHDNHGTIVLKGTQFRKFFKSNNLGQILKNRITQVLKRNQKIPDDSKEIEDVFIEDIVLESFESISGVVI